MLPDGKDSEKMLAKLNSINNLSQLAYTIFINKKCTYPEKSQVKWIRDCEPEDVENLDWRSIYLLPRKYTLSIKQTPFCLKLKFQTQIFVLLPQSPGNANPPVLGLPGNKCFLGKRTIIYFLFSVNLIQASDV